MTPVVVQKYGGSSVADLAKLEQVAERVCETVAAGRRVVVVISAMGRTTDELLELARALHPNPPRRELDMLLSAGERIASALLATALARRGQAAISFTGSQCGIITNDRHADARILEVRPYRVQDELERDRVVIIAGYQGVSYRREVTTLGRGGSDTTAVALAAALGAEYCEICSDVDGVYSADPRSVRDARHLGDVSYEAMRELARHGAKVLNAEAVAFAERHQIVLYARATEGSERFTRIGAHPPVAGPLAVTGQRSLVQASGVGGPVALRQLARRLEQHGVAPLWTRVDGQRVSAVWPGSLADDPDGLRRVLLADAGEDTLRIESQLEAATIVGHGVGDDPTHLAAVLELVDDQRWPVVGLDCAPLRATLLLREGDLDEVVRLLHERLVLRDPTATNS